MMTVERERAGQKRANIRYNQCFVFDSTVLKVQNKTLFFFFIRCIKFLLKDCYVVFTKEKREEIKVDTVASNPVCKYDY